jgi:hypothetical protein
MEITLQNRYGDLQTFNPMDDGNILWKQSGRYFRAGMTETEGDYTFIDPSGGPFIGVGTNMSDIHPELSGVVDHIQALVSEEKGHYLIVIEK